MQWYGEDILIDNLDQVHSGQFTTLLENSITSDAFQRVLFGIIQNSFKEYGLDVGERGVLGDDQYAIMTAMRYDVNIIGGIADKVVGLAKDCSMVAKRSKTVVRTTYYEYLKVRYLYGYHIPQITSISPFCGENEKLIGLPFNRVREFRALLETIKARGGDPYYLEALSLYMWNGIRNMQNFETRTKVMMPFMIYYLPITLGGVGALPWVSFGANCDAVSLFYYTFWCDEMDNAAQFVSAAMSMDSRTSIAKNLVNSSMFESNSYKMRRGVAGDYNVENLKVKTVNDYVDWGNKAFTVDGKLQPLDPRILREVAPLDITGLSEKRANRGYSEYAKSLTNIGSEGIFIHKMFTAKNGYRAAEESNQILLKAGVDLKNLTLMHAPMRLIVHSIKDNPNMIPILIEERKNFIFSKGKEGQYTNFIKSTWPDDEGPLKVEFGEVIEELDFDFYMPMLHPEIIRRIKQCGASTGPNSVGFSAEDMMKGLRGHGLPNDITAKSIINVFSSSKLSGFESLILRGHVLIAMGVEPDFAMVKAQSISEMIDYGYFNAELAIFSFNGSVERLLNLNNITLARLLDDEVSTNRLVMMYKCLLAATTVFSQRPGTPRETEIEGSAEMFISRMKHARHLVFGVLQVDESGACRGQ